MSQLPAEMEAVAAQLRDGELSAALERQRRILTVLDHVLEATSSPPGSQNASASPAGVNGGDFDQPGSERGLDNQGPAGDSSSDADGAHEVRVRAERRRNLATAVWGHLPDRVREEMIQSYSDQFLPEYDSLVERYYEALAEKRLSERRE